MLKKIVLFLILTFCLAFLQSLQMNAESIEICKTYEKEIENERALLTNAIKNHNGEYIW